MQPSLHLLAEYRMYRYIFPIRCILGLRDTYLLTDIFSDLNCTFFLFTWGWELVTKLLFLHHDAWTRLLARDVADRQRKIYFQLHAAAAAIPQSPMSPHLTLFMCFASRGCETGNNNFISAAPFPIRRDVRSPSQWFLRTVLE